MNFLDIPEGESVFIDANVFVYAFAADPTLGPPCRDLVERIGRKEHEAYLNPLRELRRWSRQSRSGQPGRLGQSTREMSARASKRAWVPLRP